MGLRRFTRLRFAILTTIALGIVTVIALLVLVSLLGGQQQPEYPLYPDHPLDLDAYASYPGAKIVKKDAPSKPILLSIEFKTNDQPGVVEAFFNDLTAKDGWHRAERQGTHKVPFYTFGGYGQQSVYGYNMVLRTQQYEEPTGSRITDGQLTIERSLPIYPGADNIITRLVPRPDIGGPVAEYTTHDSPEKIFAFYEKVMPEDGWSLLTNAKKDENSIVFFWVDDSPSQSSYSGMHNLAVVAKADNSGVTRVWVSDLTGMVQGP